MTEFNNPVPVAVGLLPVATPAGLALAAIVRNNEPNRGQLALPGGYVDQGEDAAQATARELEEEIGFVSSPRQWQLLHSATNAKNRLLLFSVFERSLSLEEYQAWAQKPPINPAEVAGFGLVALTAEPSSGVQGPQDIGFPLHRQMVETYFRALKQAERG